MNRRLLLSLLSLLLFSVSFAQSIRLTGKVVNEKNEPIPGASIRLAGGGGTSSGPDGSYSLTLTPGRKYELTVSAVGYQSKLVADVEVGSSASNLLDITLAIAPKEEAGIVVTARTTQRRESVNAIISYQKNTNTVASVISAESIRRSPDRNTGEVLKRIPGASIQDGRFLIIRGLADRYNLAMLNGVPLSSTEPDRKTFSFDLIPSAMIDNIVINKAFVPEMPGDWAGGLVQINTKDIPSRNFFTVQAGIGFNSQTVSNDFYTYRGGNLDWLGIDNGARGLPSLYRNKSTFNASTQAEKNAIGLALPNVWSANTIATPLNTQLQLSAGFTGTLLKKRIGGVFGLTYSRQSRFTMQQNNQYAFSSTGLGADYEFMDDRYSQDVLWGALGNLTLEFNSNNKLSYKTLFNINSNDYVILRRGTENFGGSVLDSVRARELGFQQNTFWSNQLTGEHNLPGIKSRLRWYGSFNILDGYTPDQRRIFYRKDNSAPNRPYEMLVADVLSQRSANRFTQNLNDYVYTAGGDLSTNYQLFDRKQTVKVGYLFQVRDRLFDAKPFSIALAGNNPDLIRLEAEQAFVAANFSSTRENGKFYFDAIQGNRFRYMANTILNAAYLQFDNEFGRKFRVVYGVRVEDYDQLVGSPKKSDPRHVYTRVRDWLPGLNATYRLNEKTNIRFSASQTVIRPEFRELAPFEFYDFELNAAVQGNASLQRTKVTNLDLRYELYPRAGETFNVGAFYKHFQLPIEQLFFQGGGGASFFPFANPESARSFGVEVEFRKRLDFAEGLKHFTFQTNVAYIRSRIVDDSLKAAGFSIDRPLQGQSPYVINASLMYDLEEKGLSATVLFNQVGRRISLVGNVYQNVPDVWENSRPLLDLQVAKKLLKNKAEVRLNVSDLLNRRLVFYQNGDDREGYDASVDPTRFSRRFGTNYTLSFLYNL
jgi:TonB-dependent receptor